MKAKGKNIKLIIRKNLKNQRWRLASRVYEIIY